MQSKSAAREIGIALGTAAVVIASEFFFRHYVTFWLPVVGNLLVTDSIALLLAYTFLLVAARRLMHVKWRDDVAGIGQALIELVTKWKGAGWLLLLVLAGSVLPVVDRLLWGQVSLPMAVSAYRNPTVWLADQAPLLRAVSLVLVNGLFVPIAQGFLWRGVVQVRLLRMVPKWLADGLTAALFSFKQVLVDASLGRLLALTAFGVICGIVAAGKDWRQPAALHLFANTATSGWIWCSVR
ncbi:MAG TPA: CPBP family glutamic-type intramembrane protease [Anaerolineaceae bacterium]